MTPLVSHSFQGLTYSNPSESDSSIIISTNSSSTSLYSRIAFGIHAHPTLVKTLELTSPILGLSLIASVPFHGHNLSLTTKAGLITAGTLLTLAGSISLFALNSFIPPHHDMTKHVYQPAEYKGNRLYYEEDIPILSLQSDNSFDAGFAHGYLCGDAINQAIKYQSFVLDTLLQQEKHPNLPKILNDIRQKIPGEYLEEMEGLLQGYKKWADEQYWWKFPQKLSLDDILLINLTPDSLNIRLHELSFDRSRLFSPFLNILGAACSSIIDENNPEQELIFARNLDWNSYGVLGTLSLIIHRQYTNKQNNTIEVGFPSLVGALTGMNNQGLCLAMNVASGGRSVPIWGMPAMLYNRMCLEQCNTVSDVENLAQTQSPLTRYHLVVADPTQAKAILFQWPPYKGKTLDFDGEKFDCHIRKKREDTPLITLNHSYSADNESEWPECPERENELKRFFQNPVRRPLKDSLALPHVNNYRTVHQVVMHPKSKLMQVAFDNAFAGKAQLHNLSTQKLFS